LHEESAIDTGVAVEPGSHNPHAHEVLSSQRPCALDLAARTRPVTDGVRRLSRSGVEYPFVASCGDDSDRYAGRGRTRALLRRGHRAAVFPRRVVVIEFVSWLPGRACHGLLSRTSPKGISPDETAIARDLA